MANKRDDDTMNNSGNANTKCPFFLSDINNYIFLYIYYLSIQGNT